MEAYGLCVRECLCVFVVYDMWCGVCLFVMCVCVCMCVYGMHVVICVCVYDVCVCLCV